MNLTQRASLILVTLGSLLSAQASPHHEWTILSPDQGQTFAYGSEKDRILRLNDHGMLSLRLVYTNSPYFDRITPLQTDTFDFSFPHTSLGADGQTISYQPPHGRAFPIAVRKKDFFGIEVVRLLPQNELRVKVVRGDVSVEILACDGPGS